MRVKFEYRDVRWLRVRPNPRVDGEPIVRMIERGCEFDVDDEIESEDGRWYHVATEPTGYVMAELVTPVETSDDQADGGALQKMKVADLRKLAEESGITLKPNMKKAEIIEALLNA